MKKSRILLLIHAKSFLYYEKTGIEKYVFELVKGLINIYKFNNNNNKKEITRLIRFVDIIIYTDGKFVERKIKGLSFNNINYKKFWTFIGLSLEILKVMVKNYLNRRYDRIILFCPAHNFPFILPKERIVTVHGLEYEQVPFCYSFFRRWYLRLVTVFSVKMATKIIAVSKTTKNDLINLYGVSSSKIKVIYHGIEKIKDKVELKHCDKKYITFIGRIEYKKNLINLIKAFNLAVRESCALKKYKIFIGGAKGYGYDKIKKFILKNLKQVKFIDRYINDKEKNNILRQTAVFYFVSYYEGFGMPVLEMQARNILILTSKNGATREIAGKGALLADPYNYEDIKNKLKKILEDNNLKRKLLKLGSDNLRRFNSWQKVIIESLNYIIS